MTGRNDFRDKPKSSYKHRSGMDPAALTKADVAVVSVMREMALKPGQMLLLGPKSVEILSTEGAFKGSLPDRFVFEVQEWRAPPPQSKKARRR